MGTVNMLQREEELLDILLKELSEVQGIEILEAANKKRLGVISFIIKNTHFNLVVKLLNDRFGIQTRGGCACAGTYGHHLLHLDEVHSYEILEEMHKGDLSCKPGWVRMSVHPTMTDEEVRFIAAAVKEVALHYTEWKTDYEYNTQTNEYRHKNFEINPAGILQNWFEKKLS